VFNVLNVLLKEKIYSRDDFNPISYRIRFIEVKKLNRKGNCPPIESALGRNGDNLIKRLREIAAKI
jgi:hypothetical protein